MYSISNLHPGRSVLCLIQHGVLRKHMYTEISTNHSELVETDTELFIRERVNNLLLRNFRFRNQL